MVKLTEKQQRDLLIALGAADFVTKGKITSVAYDAVIGIARAGGRALYGGTRAAAPAAGRFIGRGALGIARTAGMVAMRHPYLTAGAIIYVNRDQAEDLLREGYEVVSDAIMPSSRESAPLPPGVTAIDVLKDPSILRPKPALGGTRKKSKFNRAISAGMKAIKKSTKGGKKGTFTNPKAAFRTVTKTASKIRKGTKVSNKGITGIAARAMRKIYRSRGM